MNTKRYIAVAAALILAVWIVLPVNALAKGSKLEKIWWIVGTVKGNKTAETVITLKLVKKGDSSENFVSVTSTNKFNQYAFSTPENGLPLSPSAYRLDVFVGNDRIMEVPLDGVKQGGRVPPITINW